MIRKKKIAVAILAVFSALMIASTIALYIKGLCSRSEAIEMGTIKADVTFAEENPALYQDTMAAEDWNLNNYPYRVCITNPSNLASCGIDQFAVDALEPFLDLYLNLYDSSGQKYQGEVNTDSFIHNESIPQFMVVCIQQETGEELVIQCSYFVQAQLYEFSSSLSE